MMQTNSRAAVASTFSRRQRSAAALDQVEVLVRFIGAIDVKVERTRIGQGRNLEVESAQAFFRRFSN